MNGNFSTLRIYSSSVSLTLRCVRSWMERGMKFAVKEEKKNEIGDSFSGE